MSALFPVQVLGLHALPPAVALKAEVRSREIYRELEAQEFCGDEVQVHGLLSELRRDTSWVPLESLKALGLAPMPLARWQLVSTASVDAHEDFHGPTLLWTLFNDRLKLKIGRKSWVPAAGEMIVFDDRQTHQVDAPKGRGTLLLMASVPLRKCLIR